jgi:hypothetical protein
MSHTLTLYCGCLVYVSCNPTTTLAHTRIIERRGVSCRSRRHDVGTRLYLWEILSEPPALADVKIAEETNGLKETGNRVIG